MDNWVMNLDMLSLNGVIDYDAAAYLRGTAPRYVGNPTLSTGAPQMLPSSAVAQQPSQDTFEPGKIKKKRKNPLWKTLLFVVVSLGAIIIGGYKLRNTKAVKWIIDKSSKCWQGIKKGCGKAWNWVKNLFSKKKSTSTP